MTSSTPSPQVHTPSRPAVGLFARDIEARQAIQALRSLGIDHQQVGLLAPKTGATQPGSPGADVSGLLALVAGAGDLGAVLTSIGVPGGEAVERDWEASRRAGDWSTVAGPVRDVWEDVAADAAQGFEGGQDRRIPRPGNDQAGPTRDLLPPRA